MRNRKWFNYLSADVVVGFDVVCCRCCDSESECTPAFPLSRPKNLANPHFDHVISVLDREQMIHGRLTDAIMNNDRPHHLMITNVSTYYRIHRWNQKNHLKKI
jgi:hypothetical protein